MKLILAALVCIIYISDVQAVRCKAGYPKLGKGVTPPNLPDTECSGPNFEDLCYVMFTDYNLPGFDKEAYTYGCILKGSLGNCNKTFKRYGVENHYCCCKDAGCNDVDFARNCHEKRKRRK
uniref:Uncharacterized protein n=1 Tax=Clytia hemisphaerica TaxID=252671 RepID=A0A7M5V3S8_9CNID